MNSELTPLQKCAKLVAEKENPYSANCQNRHLWNEGFEKGFIQGYEELLYTTQLSCMDCGKINGTVKDRGSELGIQCTDCNKKSTN
jgi:DNA-directed RNA polymerase subunit RPC12/RpoP